MSFKPASDWVDAFVEPPPSPPLNLPPARNRTRVAMITPPPVDVSSGSACSDVHHESEPEQPDTENASIADQDAITAGDASYAVGYKRPPLHTRFKAGQSGNPRGRPRKSKSLNTIVRETLGGKIAVRTATGTKKISRIEAVLQKTLEQAMKGNPKAQTELIKLWRGAVPDEIVEDVAACEEDLTAADLAMLEAYRVQLGQNEQAGS